jgi:acetylornithine aminotransferase/acetylornithine/N-succinyldiaminopimelate aminotransferase
MRDIIPAPPAVVRNEAQTIQELFRKNVMPTYARFDLVLKRGEGSRVWDVNGKSYLDLGGGIAVCALGHANAEIAQALVEQFGQLGHVSNLYFHEGQGRLAQELSRLIAPGKVFFCNSGAEANEGLFKLARRFGDEEGRFEILTAQNSFHGRTLAGIAASGQAKVKKGFGPMTAGFRQIPFNDLAAARAALSPATAAILVEGVQGEIGVVPAEADYLLGLRRLCNEKRLLLLMDGVQCGHFRTGRFQSFQRILEDRKEEAAGFLPDAISMAKSLGGGFPMGAFWVREAFADLLGPGSHGTTYGGSPPACAVALKILEVIQRDHLADAARERGAWLKTELLRIGAKYPAVIREVRGLGLMIGIELAEKIPAFAAVEKSPAIQFIHRLHEAGALAVPSGAQIIRFLPALNLRPEEASEGIGIIESVVANISP